MSEKQFHCSKRLLSSGTPEHPAHGEKTASLSPGLGASSNHQLCNRGARLWFCLEDRRTFAQDGVAVMSQIQLPRGMHCIRGTFLKSFKLLPINLHIILHMLNLEFPVELSQIKEL